MNKTKELIAADILSKYKEYPPEIVDLFPREAAALLNVSVRTLEKWRPKRKNLPFTKTPGGVIYKLSDVLDYKKSLVIQVVVND